MSIVDEVFYLLTVSLVVLALVFVVNLGLDIEERRAAVPAALAPVSLVPLVSLFYPTMQREVDCAWEPVNGR